MKYPWYKQLNDLQSGCCYHLIYYISGFFNHLFTVSFTVSFACLLHIYCAWMLINMNQGLRPMIEAWGCRQMSWCIHLGWMVLFRCIKPSHHAREMKASNGTILTLFYSYHSYHAWELICEFSDFIPHSIPAATNGWIGFNAISHKTAGMTWYDYECVGECLYSNERTQIIQVITFFQLSLFIPDHL